MNCTIIQRRLLSLSDPDQVPLVVRDHLESCPACREVQRRLMQLEAHVPLLPVPATPAREEFLQQFRTSATVWEKLGYRVRNLQRWQLTAAALAASLLLFALVWCLAPDDGPPAAQKHKPHVPDKLLAGLVRHNVKLAMTASPKEQVETLADLAEDVRGQSQALLYYGTGRPGKEALQDVADWYGQVVRMGVERAGQLPPQQRKPVLAPIVQKLADAGDDAERLASEVQNISADHPLLNIVFAARNGKDQLETLLKHEMTGTVAPQRHCRQQPPRPPSQRAAVWQLDVLPIACAAVASVRADNSAPAVLAADQAQRFQRNRKLIGALVDNCLQLARQIDVVHRADSCTVVADRLAEEIQRAVDDRDFARAAELARLLKDLLVQGVAFNLTTAEGIIPRGAVREPEVLQIGDHVNRIAARLRENLQAAMQQPLDKPARDHCQRALTLVTDAQSAVDQALKGRRTQ